MHAPAALPPFRNGKPHRVVEDPRFPDFLGQVVPENLLPLERVVRPAVQGDVSRVGGPPWPNGIGPWWNSRNARSVHRRPSGPMKAHRSSSRSETSRRVRAGTCREPPAASPGSAAGQPHPPPHPRPRRLLPPLCGRRSAFPCFLLSTAARRRSRPRSKSTAGSPLGISRFNKRLEAAQLLLRLLADRELDAIALAAPGASPPAVSPAAGPRPPPFRRGLRSPSRHALWIRERPRPLRHRRTAGAGRRSGAEPERAGVGSLRTVDGTSGLGFSRATIFSTSRFDAPAASFRAASQFESLSTGRQEPDRRQAEPSVGQHVEDDGVPARHPGRRLPVVRRVLGVAEGLAAIGVERRVSRRSQQLSLVQLRQVRDETRRHLSLVAGEIGNRRDQLVVREVGRKVRFSAWMES